MEVFGSVNFFVFANLLSAKIFLRFVSEHDFALHLLSAKIFMQFVSEHAF